MKRSTIFALIGMWCFVLFMLVNFAYQNPGLGIVPNNGPIPTQNQMTSGIQQFFSDMSSNLQIPKGLG